MDASSQLESLYRLCSRLGIEVRLEHLGGGAGGLCSVRGRRVLFVDLDSDRATRWARSCRAVAELAELDAVYLTPVLREQIDQICGPSTIEDSEGDAAAGAKCP